ncbi:MAG: WD40 repeat domain-containing protein [Pirellulales bacterium]
MKRKLACAVAVILTLVAAGALYAKRLSVAEEVRRIVTASCVTSIAVSADGTTLATGDEEGKVTWWDIEAWTPRTRVATEGNGRIGVLEISADGKLVACGSGSGGVVVLDTATASQVFRGNVDLQLSDLSFSRDGRQLAVAGRKSTGSAVDLWQTGDWTRNPILSDSTEDITAIQFAASGESLFVQLDGLPLREIELPSGRLRRTFDATEYGEPTLAADKDGALLIVGSAILEIDGGTTYGVDVVDLSASKRLQRIPFQGGKLRYCDGNRLLVGVSHRPNTIPNAVKSMVVGGSTLHVYEAESGRELLRQRSRDQLNDAAALPEQNLVVAVGCDRPGRGVVVVYRVPQTPEGGK